MCILFRNTMWHIDMQKKVCSFIICYISFFNRINVLTDVRAGPGHPDCALSGGDAVEVPLGADAHGGAHRHPIELPAHLDRPLHLLDVLVVLRKGEQGSFL